MKSLFGSLETLYGAFELWESNSDMGHFGGGLKGMTLQKLISSLCERGWWPQSICKPEGQLHHEIHIDGTN